MWAVVARVVRAHVATLREHEFVEAARALGASDLRILVRHLLPNAAGTVLVAATSLVGQIVLIDATVEFFGYGLPVVGRALARQPRGGRRPVQVRPLERPGHGRPRLVDVVFPGLVLVPILVCVNLVGDALDAALNPATVRG